MGASPPEEPAAWKHVEAGPGVDPQTLSKEIRAKCQDVFKLTMDKIEFLVKDTLPDDYKKFVDTRWG